MKLLIAAAMTAALTGESTAQATARTVALTQVMRIDGAKEDLSGTSSDFWLGRGGRVAVFDGPTARYVFFDSTGKRLGAFGAQGQGPGEFAPSVANMYSLQSGIIGDTMWVYQSATRRFTLITPDFKLARTLLLPTTDAARIVSFRPLLLLANDRVLGGALFGARVNATLADGRTVSTTTQSDSAFIVLGRGGSVERRVAAYPPNSSMAVVNNPGQQYRFSPVPFRGPPLAVVSPLGDRMGIVTTSITSATGGDFQVTVVRASGDTVFTRKYPYTSAPVTKSMADSAMETRERVYGSGARMGSEEMLALLRKLIPPVTNPFNGMEVGTDGTVWLHRDRRGMPSEWLVFSPTGDQLGTVTMPRRGLSLRAIDGTRVWATETDEDGFVSIVLFRIANLLS